MPEDATCSRAKSRVARALLRKRGILGAAAPATCPLHADLYGDQEQHKRALRRSLYKCAYCGKTFSSEDWLDRHFDRKHADTLAADGFCLGDLCDVLDCAAAPRLARTRPSYYDDDDGARDDDGYRGSRRRRRYDDDGDDDRPGRAAVKRASALATPCDADSLAAGRARCKAALAACSLAVEADALCDARCVNGRVLVAPTVDAGPAVAAAPAAGSPRLYGAFLAAFYALLYYCTRGSSSSSRDAPRRRSSRARPHRYHRLD